MKADMDARKFFIAGTIRLISLALYFALWLAIFIALALGIRHRPAQQYAEGDEISPLFAVAVRNVQGEIQAQPLNRWKSSETLVREDTVLRDREGIYLQLTRLPPDTFELFYASNRLDANAFMTARYRITADNKVIPVSFKVWRGARIFGVFAAISRVCACQMADIAAAVGQEKAACTPK